MNLAFDARAFGRPLDSMDRVLRVLVCAAREADWNIELWLDGELRPDAEAYRPWVRPVADDDSKADALWSPEMSVVVSGLPSVATLHDVNPLLPDGRPALARWLRRRRFRRRVGALLTGLDRLVTDTEDAKQRVIGAFPKSAGLLSVVPLFVDPHIMPLGGEEGRRILDRFALAPGFVLFVGSMRRHKNWDGLMRAFARLTPALQAAHPLVFAGRSRRARADAARLMQQLGIEQHVRILGVVDDRALHALYGGAGVLACPSFMEGFGFPPLEAMACSVPVLATNRTCVPEVLGDAAAYIDPDSVPEMAEALARVLTDKALRANLVEAGVRRARTFTPQRTAAAMSNVLAGLS